MLRTKVQKPMKKQDRVPFTVGDVRNMMRKVEEVKAETLTTTYQIEEYNRRAQAIWHKTAKNYDVLLEDTDSLVPTTPLSVEADSMFRSLVSWLKLQHRAFV